MRVHLKPILKVQISLPERSIDFDTGTRVETGEQPVIAGHILGCRYNTIVGNRLALSEGFENFSTLLATT